MRRRAWALLLLAALLLGATVPAVADGDRGGKGNGGDGPGRREGRGDGHGGDDRDDEDGDPDHEDGSRDDEDDGEGHDPDERGDDGRKDAQRKAGGKPPKADAGIPERERDARSAADPGNEGPGAPGGPRMLLRQDLLAAGNGATYEVIVRNDGTDAAPAVAIAADLPAGGWRSEDPACQVVAGHLSCLLGPLAPGDEVVVQARGILVDGSPYPAVVQAVTPL